MKKKCIWATSHNITIEQTKELEKLGYNIVFLSDSDIGLLNKMSTLKIDDDLVSIANCLLLLALENKADIIQPSGSPKFQFILGGISANMYRDRFHDRSFTPVKVLYSHSDRVSEDIPQPDGTVKKISTFKHVMFI